MNAAMPRTALQTRSSQARARLNLDTIYEIAKLLAAAPDPVAQMPVVLNILHSFVELRFGALALLSDQAAAWPAGATTPNPYSIAATIRGTRPEVCDPSAIPIPVAQMVFKTGVPLISWDMESEFGRAAKPDYLGHGGFSMVAVPMRAGGSSPLVLGVLCAFRSHESEFAGQSDEDLALLSMVATLFEQSLRFRKQVARDRERSMQDARRAFNSLRGETGTENADFRIEGIVGDSKEIAAVIARIRKVAKTSAAVLLRGESGTGKELFARAIHTLSDRKDKPFIRVNCAALSETLLESELFGHEKGAFTGAQSLKKGRFELADGGTLFLDEIGEISGAFQAKLLRVLQEGEFERVGGSKTLKVNVRLVSATNRDLEEAVATGGFRADLYFRICVVPIVLPPLRDRVGDIEPLAQAFLDKFNAQNGTQLTFHQDAFETLCRCKFPGNVRELENCVNRAAALAGADEIRDLDMACTQGSCLSAELWRLQSGDASPIGGLSAGHVIRPSVQPTAPVAPMADLPAGCPVHPQPRKTANTDRDELIAAMEQAGWVQAKAARLLGMTPRQIGYALKKHGVEVQRF